MTKLSDAHNEAAPAWTRSLQPGDIVAFEFPHEKPGDEAPKLRPTLVLGINRSGDQHVADLAYGTSQPCRRRLRQEYAIPVVAPDELNAASLHQPTRFDPMRRVSVPLSDSRFGVHAVSGTPVLGRLTGAAKACMNQMWDRLRAGQARRRARLFRRPKTQAMSIADVARSGRTLREVRYV